MNVHGCVGLIALLGVVYSPSLFSGHATVRTWVHPLSYLGGAMCLLAPDFVAHAVPFTLPIWLVLLVGYAVAAVTVFQQAMATVAGAALAEHTVRTFRRN